MPPYLSNITNTFFVNLINRLGVRPPPPDGFDLINTVQPVSIVDSDITLSAVSTSQLLDIPFTAGPQAAPAANTVLADTLAQTPGVYQITVLMSSVDTLNANVMNLQRRDAANAANIWAVSFVTGLSASGIGTWQVSYRVQLQLNERIRLLTGLASGAGSTYSGSIWLQPVT